MAIENHAFDLVRKHFSRVLFNWILNTVQTVHKYSVDFFKYFKLMNSDDDFWIGYKKFKRS